MDIHISTERRWPSPQPQRPAAAVQPRDADDARPDRVYRKVVLEAALFSPESGLDVSFAEVAEFLPALQLLDIVTLQRPERVMEAIGRHLVNLRTLNLCILFNQNWADEFMRRGGQPIRSETVPASADFREQFLSIVQEAELSRMRATPLEGHPDPGSRCSRPVQRRSQRRRHAQVFARPARRRSLAEPGAATHQARRHSALAREIDRW